MKKLVLMNLLRFASAALLVVTAAPTMAAPVTLFADNFDNVTVGTAPSAQVGSWAVAENVVGDTVSGAPSGTQYLECTRPDYDNHWGQSMAVANAGTSLHAEFYINGDDAAGFAPQLGLWGTGSADQWPSGYGVLVTLHDDNTVNNFNGTDQVLTPLTWTPTTWQKWEIDYVAGATSYDLTVDGSTTTVPDALTPGAVQGIYFTTGAGAGTFRVDSALLTAAPGPSGIMSLGNVTPSDPTTWNSGGNVHVGSSSYGEVAITNGAQVTYDKYLVAGAGSSADGTIVVSGAGSRLEDLTKTTADDQRFLVGENGTGRLEVLDGGVVSTSYIDYIGTNAGSSGTVLVDGADSLYTSPHSINVGYRAGSTGEMTIQNGGTVNAGGWFVVGGNAPDGGNAAAQGITTVTGAGSELISAGPIYVGYQGDGTLNILNDGKITAGSLRCSAAGGTAEVNFDNTTADLGGLMAASHHLHGTGTINTKGIVANMDLVFDSTASLTRTITGYGVDSGITINLDVDGTGTRMGAGLDGEGSIIISSGINITAGVGYIGALTGGDGTGLITGAGSTWEVDHMLVGNGGVGNLKIENGGLLQVNDTLYIDMATLDSTIDMANGGMLSLHNDTDLSGSIATLLDAIVGDGTIQWWDASLGAWADITTATSGTDYTLSYDAGTGHTLLTVTANGQLNGDANGDGTVNAEDAAILAQHWLKESGATWEDGDFNRDGAVNGIDATILAANWQNTQSASVPEPSMIVLMLAGLLGLCTRHGLLHK